MNAGRVLVVDDDRPFGSLLAKICREEGYQAEIATTGGEALDVLGKFAADAALVDVCLGEESGIELLRQMHLVRPGLPAIMVTAFADIPRAVAAVRAGAYDFVQKPIDNAQLLRQLAAMIGSRSRNGVESETRLSVGRDPAYRRVIERAMGVASTDLSVLILGETGTGKEVLANLIHAHSAKSGGPLLALDCSSIPETLIESELFGHERGSFTGATALKRGLFELASGGTLFLDEIGNLPIAIQPKLLRALETRAAYRVGGLSPIRYNVRLIAATNADLRTRADDSAFRRDLYYRLCEIELRLPPLRERGNDVRLLSEHFLEEHARQAGRPTPKLAEETRKVLAHHDWPGNVRELRSALKSALFLANGGPVIEPDHLPETVRHALPGVASRVRAPAADGRQTVHVEFEFAITKGAAIDLKAVTNRARQAAERALLEALVHEGRGARTRLAKTLGIDEKTLRTKLRRYGLKGPSSPTEGKTK